MHLQAVAYRHCVRAWVRPLHFKKQKLTFYDFYSIERFN